jgi:hypothetical protein
MLSPFSKPFYHFAVFKKTVIARPTHPTANHAVASVLSLWSVKTIGGEIFVMNPNFWIKFNKLIHLAI